MSTPDPRTEAFEAHRPHLHAVAYRMLGTLAEADDAVQDAWLRYSRADTFEVHNLGGWLTTVVARGRARLCRTAGRRSLLRPRLCHPRGRIVELDVVADPERLSQLDLSVLHD
jgi:RNA polymerase sigma-70 factor (ECF subfamily)